MLKKNAQRYEEWEQKDAEQLRKKGAVLQNIVHEIWCTIENILRTKRCWIDIKRVQFWKISTTKLGAELKTFLEQKKGADLENIFNLKKTQN